MIADTTEARFWDREAEECVLAACLSNADAPADAIELGLRAEFFSSTHAPVFRAIVSIAETDTRITVPAVAQWLSAHGALDDVGGLTGLMDIPRRAPFRGLSAVATYGPVILERAQVRREYQRAWAYCQELMAAGADVQGVMARYRADLDAMDAVNTGGPWSIREAVEELYPELERWAENPQAIHGIRTGIGEFDMLAGGLQTGMLSIVGASTSAGKTQFIQHIVRYASIGGTPSLLLSTEMSRRESVFRWVFQEAGFDKLAAQRDGMDEARRGRFRDAAWTLGERGNVFGWEVGSFDLSRIAAAVRRYRRRHGVRLVAVDLLNGLDATPTKGENLAQVIMRNVAGLKALAQHEDVHVMATAHMKREAMTALTVPGLHDFRDSGAIEQWADLALMLCTTDENGNVTTREQAALFVASHGWVPVLGNVCKNRHGALGAVHMRLNWDVGGKFVDARE